MSFCEYNGKLFRSIDEPPKKVKDWVGLFLVSKTVAPLEKTAIVPGMSFRAEDVVGPVKKLVEVKCRCCGRGLTVSTRMSKKELLDNFYIAEEVKNGR